MLNKELLSAFGLLVGTGVLVVANGMDADFADTFGDDRQPVMAVAAGAAAGDGARAMEFSLYECGADFPTKRARVPFRAASLGEFSGLADLPVETSKEHKFSDMSWQVDQGCYMATARPVDARGKPIEGCSTAKTPVTFLDDGLSQQFALVSTCDRPAANGIEVAGEFNRAPTLADLSVERIEDSQSCDTVRICATARDADHDPMALHWSVEAEQGGPLHLPAPQRSEGDSHLTECVEVTPGNGRWNVEVTVRDQKREGQKLITREDAYLGDYGLVAHSRDSRSVSVAADCEAASCPEDPTERITDLTYWITRDGRLLAPTDDLSRVRQGDMVDVEFEVAPGCSDTQVTFASYTGDERREPASVFSQSYDAGPHLLWNVLPDCNFIADVHLGPPLDDHERPAADNPYGEHLIDTYRGGSTACGERAQR